jgi:hypothetical protein
VVFAAVYIAFTDRLLTIDGLLASSVFNFLNGNKQYINMLCRCSEAIYRAEGPTFRWRERKGRASALP